MRCLIFAQGRTGSTLLEDLISSTGYFNKRGEVLNTEFQSEIEDPLSFMKSLPDWIICHVKIYHLLQDRSNPIRDTALFLKDLKQDGWHIIYLERLNRVKHALSNIVAEKHRCYRANTKVDFQVEVDPYQLSQWIDYRDKWKKEEEAALSLLESYLHLTYESDLECREDHEDTVRKVLAYLKLEYKKFSPSSLVKINSKPLKDMVINYQEFLDYIYRNDLSRWL